MEIQQAENFLVGLYLDAETVFFLNILEVCVPVEDNLVKIRELELLVKVLEYHRTFAHDAFSAANGGETPADKRDDQKG